MAARLDADVNEHDPERLPWLPLLAITLDVEVAPIEVQMLDQQFRRPSSTRSSHASSTRCSRPRADQIEDAHHMDEASAELLRAIAEHLPPSALALLRDQPPGQPRIRAPRRPAIMRLERRRSPRKTPSFSPRRATGEPPDSAASPPSRRTSIGRESPVPTGPDPCSVATGGAGGLPTPVRQPPWHASTRWLPTIARPSDVPRLPDGVTSISRMLRLGARRGDAGRLGAGPMWPSSSRTTATDTSLPARPPSGRGVRGNFPTACGGSSTAASVTARRGGRRRRRRPRRGPVAPLLPRRPVWTRL